MTIERWTIEYGDGPKLIEDVSTEEVRSRLREVTDEASQPVLFTINASQDKALTIGLGANFSALTWIDEADQERPYLRSSGDADGGEPSSWWLGNQPSEFPPGTGIPWEQAWGAVEEFLQTGELPNNVEWVE